MDGLESGRGDCCPLVADTKTVLVLVVNKSMRHSSKNLKVN